MRAITAKSKSVSPHPSNLRANQFQRQLEEPETEVRFHYDGLDPDRHYLIPYDGAGVSKHPRGISGAAVWWESDEKKIIWTPNFRFAGTVTHSHKNGRIVRVVKASVVRRFLTELFGQSGEG